jgi:hypothetical protein
MAKMNKEGVAALQVRSCGARSRDLVKHHFRPVEMYCGLPLKGARIMSMSRLEKFAFNFGAGVVTGAVLALLYTPITGTTKMRASTPVRIERMLAISSSLNR